MSEVRKEDIDGGIEASLYTTSRPLEVYLDISRTKYQFHANLPGDSSVVVLPAAELPKAEPSSAVE